MTNADWAPAPTLRPSGPPGPPMPRRGEPQDQVAPELLLDLFTTRSGEMPPLNTNRFGSVAAPFWNRRRSPRRSRTNAPRRPRRPGRRARSTARWRAMRRIDRGDGVGEAAVKGVDGVRTALWGAGDGGEYCGTVTAVATCGMFAVPSLFFVTLYSSSSVPVAPEFVLSGTATTHPSRTDRPAPPARASRTA